MASRTGPRPWMGAAAAVALAAVCMAVYWGALHADFVFDDHVFFRWWCWQVDTPADLLRVPFTGECTYRRVRYLSLALDHLLWGRNPVGYHLTNVLLHGLTILFVFGLLRRLGLGLRGAVVGALLWALHPVHTDVVTYVAGRRDLLCAVFFLAALAAWPRRRMRGWATALRVVLALALFVLAFESKEVAIALPAVLLLELLLAPSLRAARDGTPVPSPWAQLGAILRRFWWAWVPLGLLTVGAFLYRAVLYPVTPLTGRLYGGDLYHHVLTIPAAYAKYAELTVFPLRLYGDYSDYPPATGLADPRVWVGLLFLLVIWGGGLWQARRHPYLAFGLLWFGLVMLPMSQIVPHHELLAEHYLYIPLMGLAVSVGRGVELAWARPRARVWVASGVLVLAALFTLRVVARNRDFRSEEAFANVILEHVPGSIRGRLTRVHALQVQGRFDEALRDLDYVLAHIGPDSRFHHTAMENKLTCLVVKGDLQGAEAQVFAMLRVYPRDAYATRVLGTIRARQGLVGKALVYLRAAVQGAPRDVEGHLHLGVTLLQAGRLDEAEPHLAMAAERWPDSPDAQLEWAMLAYDRDQSAEAAHRFEHVLALDPTNRYALERLFVLARDAGQRDRACRYFERLLPLRPDLATLPSPCPTGTGAP